MDTSEHIETIFDYATEKELEELGHKIHDKNNYIKFHTTLDGINGDLARLGMIRGDKVFEKKYLDRIPESKYKFWLTYQDCF
ncbi:MAG TPA: hypothetical protein PLT06_11195 [Syntrophorhabdaceae bacterium]|nr:hypothetical protein [Syntrophorhabdaceae bacterium]HQG51869.1 hypothetical protein [Syntrophorhabdaceae bacterium]HQI57436.1 hypothetical protein [Syntrophorhabdaceae bacterium]HQJ95385.1 hypothetical protein [Syntrophorhabdaceae bacterium]